MDQGGGSPGSYLGTEIGGKWWHRYSGEGFLARGNGEYRLDGSSLLFRRYLTKTTISIPFEDVVDVETARWHAGRWAGGAPIVRMHWRKGDMLLVSGFVLSRDAGETAKLAGEIRARIRPLPGSDGRRA